MMMLWGKGRSKRKSSIILNRPASLPYLYPQASRNTSRGTSRRGSFGCHHQQPQQYQQQHQQEGQRRPPPPPAAAAAAPAHQ